jgi:hypothetical protein
VNNVPFFLIGFVVIVISGILVYLTECTKNFLYKQQIKELKEEGKYNFLLQFIIFLSSFVILICFIGIFVIVSILIGQFVYDIINGA